VLRVHDASSEFAFLERLDRCDLVEIWVKTYGAAPFKGARKKTLVRGITYHMQCRMFGGLKPSQQRQLLKLAGPSASVLNDIPKTKSPLPKIKLGSQLVREWNGRTYTVQVTPAGFVMRGVTYGSLSAAAKAITGAHWSGPRFFGVTS